MLRFTRGLRKSPTRSSAGCLVLCVLLAGPARVFALHPDSPEVKAAVAKAVAYLETHEDGGAGYARPGAKPLVGIVMIKAGKPKHPRVLEAIQTIRNQVLAANAQPDIYTLGLSLMFLTEQDLPAELREQNSDLILGLIEQLKARQKPHGGWGYPSYTTGDTSMTQYAALGLWAAEALGYEAPLDVWERLTNWLIRTQAANGAFGYQGNDPGTYEPARQERTTLSMCSAGAASLYVCADHFRLLAPELEEKDDTPAAMKRVKKSREQTPTGAVEAPRLNAALQKSDQLLNNFVPEPTEALHSYPYYYIYASERYRSFRDYANGKLDVKEPDWYTAGARHLIGKQTKEGTWLGHAQEVGVVPDTCFATLFLLRSMKKGLEKVKHLGAGMLVGGRGLPKNMNEVVLGLGGVKAKKVSGPALKLLEIIGDPNDPKFESVMAGIEDQGIPAGDEIMPEIAKKLRDLIKGKSPQARAAALTALARSRDLDQVPLLIEALKDPEPLVFSAANEGLRFMSRKFYGAGFWGGTDEKTRKQAIDQWKEWYLSVRPDAILED